MNTKLFVGNLDYSTMEQQLHDAFAQFGEVLSARVITDRMTGQSRGFGFVEFGNPQDAERAIQEMDGQSLNGRPLRVNIAEERRDRGGRSGGGGGRDFGGGGGGRDFGGGGGGRDFGGGGGGGGGGRGGRDFGGGRGGRDFGGGRGGRGGDRW